MSREARMFLLLRSWVDDAIWNGYAGPRVIAMEYRLRMEAACLIGYLA